MSAKVGVGINLGIDDGGFQANGKAEVLASVATGSTKGSFHIFGVEIVW